MWIYGFETSIQIYWFKIHSHVSMDKIEVNCKMLWILYQMKFIPQNQFRSKKKKTHKNIKSIDIVSKNIYIDDLKYCTS